MNLTPDSTAWARPASSAVTMVMRPGEVPMCRKIKGKTPCPMLPKPTMTILPANFTCTSCVLITFLPCCFPKVNSSVAPMGRIGPFVPGKRLDAMNPACQCRVIAFHGQESRAQFGRGATIQRPPQYLNPGENHHVERGIIRAYNPFLLAQAPFDGTRLAPDQVHGIGQVVDVRADPVGEDRAHDLLYRRFRVVLKLADNPHDDAGFFRSQAKNGRLRILQVQVVEDGHGFEHDVVAVLEYGHAAARIHLQHLRRLMPLVAKMQQWRLVLDPLVLQRQEDPPRESAAAAPIKSECHSVDCSG